MEELRSVMQHRRPKMNFVQFSVLHMEKYQG